MSQSAHKSSEVTKVKVGSLVMWLCDSDYAGCSEIFATREEKSAINVNNQGGFLIDDNCLLTVINPPKVPDLLSIFAPLFAESSITMTGTSTKRGAAEFIDFFDNWNHNILTLTREFSTDHFCWPELRQGRLVSEGSADLPMFTMGNTQKTRWLPTAYYPDYPNGIGGIALAGVKKYTLEFIEGTGAFVPIGVYARIVVGRSKPLKICWLNGGETVVQGPLNEVDYTIDRMILVKRINQVVDFKVIDVSDVNVKTLPQRPFEAPNLPQTDGPQMINALTIWWADLQTRQFMQAIAARLV
jgi:hypothetical protein